MSEIACQGCGACCTNVKLILHATEVERLKAVGTKLTAIIPAIGQFEFKPISPEKARKRGLLWAAQIEGFENKIATSETEEDRQLWVKLTEIAKELGPGEGYYEMPEDCGFLQEDGTCGDYENRPQVCRDFPVGDPACYGFRQREGVDVPVQLTTKMTVS